MRITSGELKRALRELPDPNITRGNVYNVAVIPDYYPFVTNDAIDEEKVTVKNLIFYKVLQRRSNRYGDWLVWELDVG